MVPPLTDCLRKRAAWSAYVVALVHSVQRSVRQHSDISKLRFLLYPSRLLPEDVETIKKGDAGVIWLGKQAGEPSDLQQPILPMPGLLDGKANADTP